MNPVVRSVCIVTMPRSVCLTGTRLVPRRHFSVSRSASQPRRLTYPETTTRFTSKLGRASVLPGLDRSAISRYDALRLPWSNEASWANCHTRSFRARAKTAKANANEPPQSSRFFQRNFRKRLLAGIALGLGAPVHYWMQFTIHSTCRT